VIHTLIRARQGLWAFAFLAFVGCSTQANRGNDGETHFITCRTDSECVHDGGAFSCVRGICQADDRSNPDADISDGSDGRRGDAHALSDASGADATDAGLGDARTLPACGGPPATLSLGAYPSDIDQWMGNYGVSLGHFRWTEPLFSNLVTIQAVGSWPSGCGTPTTANALAARVDQDLFNLGYKPGDIFGLEGPNSGSSSFSVGEQIVIFPHSGITGSPTCTSVSSFDYLNLSQYPNAVADISSLNTFLTNRAVYQQVVASRLVAVATVTSVGARVAWPMDPSQYYVDLTLQIQRTLCGQNARTVTVRFTGDQILANNGDDFREPAAGSRLIVALTPVTGEPSVAPASYELSLVLPTSSLAQVTSFLVTPPSLSL